MPNPLIMQEIDNLSRTLKEQFEKPEFLPGCEIKAITDKDLYATDNGWIEAVCNHHNQQRVRWKGQYSSVGTGQFIDVLYFPDRRIFEVYTQGGTATALTPASTGRELLTANRTYYVDVSTGSDSDDGLTSGNAFLTMQKAVDTIATLDLATYDITVDVANGTYTSNVTLKPLITSGGEVTFTGDTSTPSNVLINVSNNVIIASHQTGIYNLEGFRLQCNISGTSQILCSTGSIIKCKTGIEFHTGDTSGPGRHIFCSDNGSLVSMENDYTITGDVARHYEAQFGGFIQAANITVTCSGTRAFTTFALAGMTGLLRIHGNTWTGAGSATGTRYSGQLNAVIRTDGATLPGDVAGSTAEGAIHIMYIISVLSLDAVVNGLDEADAWQGVEFLLSEHFTGSEYDTELAKVQADEAEKTSGPKNFIVAAQSEIDYLNTAIPLIDTMSNTEVRSVVKRLAQENRQVIRALLYLSKRI